MNAVNIAVGLTRFPIYGCTVLCKQNHKMTIEQCLCLNSILSETCNKTNFKEMNSVETRLYDARMRNSTLKINFIQGAETNAARFLIDEPSIIIPIMKPSP